MPSFGKRMDVPGGSRGVPRQKVTLVGAAATLEGSCSVIIEDVCSTGAKLRGKALPPVGDHLVIHIGPAGLFARVAWSNREHCGVVFEPALIEDDVQLIKDEGCLGRVMGMAIV